MTVAGSPSGISHPRSTPSLIACWASSMASP